MADPQQVPWYLRPVDALTAFRHQGQFGHPDGAGGVGHMPAPMAPMPQTAYPQQSRPPPIGQIVRPGALAGAPPGGPPPATALPDQDNSPAALQPPDQLAPPDATPPDTESANTQSDQPGGASMAPPGGAGGGPNLSFGDLWKHTPQKQKDQQLDQLDKQVGGIDQAYDALVQKMGDRPDTKLTRSDKGELLMEFGLHLMSYSAANRHGTDAGAAVGDAGIDAVQSYRNMKAGKKQDQDTYDRTMGAIETARNNAKSNVVKQDMEQRKTSAQIDRDEASAAASQASVNKTNAEAANVGVPPPKWLVHDDADGHSYAIDANSPKKRIDLGKNDPNQIAGAKGNRPFEFQTKYDYYMDVYGKDKEGADLSGDALKGVAKKALDFANRTTGMSKGDAYKTARADARKSADSGAIDNTADAIDAETDRLFGKLYPKGEGGDGESAEQDVTDQFPKGAIEQLPDGKQVKNSKGQVVVRRGNKVFYVGQ